MRHSVTSRHYLAFQALTVVVLFGISLDIDANYPGYNIQLERYYYLTRP